jgi:predicted alpha/beta-fold hydrolase
MSINQSNVLGIARTLRLLTTKAVGLPLAILRTPGLVKIALFLAGVLGFMFYRARKQKFSKIFKKSTRNLKIIEQLSGLLATYNPTFWLPTAESQIFRGTTKNIPYIIKYELIEVKLADGEDLHVDVFPRDFADMPPTTPIVAFVLGACGSTKEPYCRQLTQYVADKGWRIAILNRRGFSEHATTSRLLHKEDYNDIHQALCKLNEVFAQAPIYLVGVSAGANQSARYLGHFGEDTPVKGYVSISNPFNLCRISYTMKSNFWGNIFSRAIVKNFKKVLDRNMKNPLFQELVRLNFECSDKWNVEMDKVQITWQMDKFFATKASGFESVYDYYYHISSEHVVDNIRVPTLVVSCAEDPVCLKENIPYEKLYRNENIVTLIAARGGHIEYLSGKNEEWFGFKIALKYFEMLETDPTLQRALPAEYLPKELTALTGQSA